MGQIGRVLSDFEGVWRVTRDIAHGDGARARFAGVARWVPVAEGLHYVERGEMRMPGHAPMQAERRYLWREDLSVWFEDGRFFHQVPETGGQAEHWCDPDMYRVRYDFADWPAFQATWEVTGPRKDYRMVSRYLREMG